MSTKMKGLLKGLRYISHIFEEQREKELQIGLPTDVKHVAHIGWDGLTASAPSWISKCKSEGDSSGATSPPNGDSQNVPRVQDPRLPRFSTGSDSSLESPSPRRRSSRSKGSRRHSSQLARSSMDSPRRSSTSDTTRTKSLLELDSPARDSTSSSMARKKKSKSSSKSKPVDQSVNGSSYSDPGLAAAASESKDKGQSSVHAL